MTHKGVEVGQAIREIRYHTVRDAFDIIRFSELDHEVNHKIVDNSIRPIYEVIQENIMIRFIVLAVALSIAIPARADCDTNGACCSTWAINTIDSRTGKVTGSLFTQADTLAAKMAAVTKAQANDRRLCKYFGPSDSDCFTTYSNPYCRDFRRPAATQATLSAPDGVKYEVLRTSTLTRPDATRCGTYGEMPLGVPAQFKVETRKYTTYQRGRITNVQTKTVEEFVECRDP